MHVCLKIILHFIPQNGWNAVVWLVCSNDESSQKVVVLSLFSFSAADKNPGLSHCEKCVGQAVRTSENLYLFVKHGSLLKWDCCLWDIVLNVFCCFSLSLTRVGFSFSRGLKCRLRGPQSPQTHPPYGLVHRLPQRLSTPLINQSWWLWHPCLSPPHRLHSTTSHRWDKHFALGQITFQDFPL